MAQCWGEGVGEISQNRDERSWPDARMSEAVQWKPEMCKHCISRKPFAQSDNHLYANSLSFIPFIGHWWPWVWIWGRSSTFYNQRVYTKNPFFYYDGCTWSSVIKNKYVCLQHSSRRTMEEKISCFAEKPRSICGILVYNAYYVYYAYNACIIGNRVKVPFFIRIGQRLDHLIGITQKSYCLVGSVFFLLLFGFV